MGHKQPAQPADNRTPELLLSTPDTQASSKRAAEAAAESLHIKHPAHQRNKTSARNRDICGLVKYLRPKTKANPQSALMHAQRTPPETNTKELSSQAGTNN